MFTEKGREIHRGGRVIRGFANGDWEIVEGPTREFERTTTYQHSQTNEVFGGYEQFPTLPASAYVDPKLIAPDRVTCQAREISDPVVVHAGPHRAQRIRLKGNVICDAPVGKCIEE